MEKVTEGLLSEYAQKFNSFLSTIVRDEKFKELELNLLHSMTPANQDEDLMDHYQELKILEQNWIGKKDTLIGVNMTALKGNKINIHRLNNLRDVMSNEFDSEFISNDLRHEYLNREIRLCELLDEMVWYNPSWKEYDPDDLLEDLYEDHINAIRRVQSQMSWILELAKEQAIWVEPVLIGLQSINFGNLTKQNTQKKPNFRTNAQNRIKYSLFLLRKRATGKQRPDDVPESFSEIMCLA